jgi:2-amino-4-hydroxy-6-hydroxymethyldihydropteridine diphosphokinase
MQDISPIEVYIGVGSNLSNPRLQVRNAIAQITQAENITLISASSLYISKPMGPQDQDDYVNAVICIETNLAPLELLDTLQAFENEAGRVRKDNRWGARILDLDILLFGELVMDTQRLTLPHYGMKEREFVIFPLEEITEEFILPDGDSVKFLSQSIEHNGMKRIS